MGMINETVQEYIATLEAENKQLKEWLQEDCFCEYMANAIEENSDKDIDKMIAEIALIKSLLKENCSCKG